MGEVHEGGLDRGNARGVGVWVVPYKSVTESVQCTTLGWWCTALV